MASIHEYIEYASGKFRELLDTTVLTGVIVSVDYSADTAVVNIAGIGVVSGVPVFYHCAGSETVEGGSAAFVAGDSVYILNADGDLTITGFVDGLKSCGWKFKLYRDDDTTIRDIGGNITTPSGSLINVDLLESITIKDSEGNWVGGISSKVLYPELWEFIDGIWYYSDALYYPEDAWTGSYNPSTGYFAINFAVGYSPVEGDTYWAFYEDNTKTGLATQYPYRYKSADQEAAEDRISIGTYNVNIPYWSTYEIDNNSYEWDPVPNIVEMNYPVPPMCSSYAGLTHGDPFSLLLWKNQFTVGNRLKTSIPYKVRYEIGKAPIIAYGYTIPDPFTCGDAKTECAEIFSSGTSIRDLITLISGDGLFDKIYSDLIAGGASNIEDSNWLDRPASIETEDIRTLVVENNKTHSEYYQNCLNEEDDSEQYQVDLVYIRQAYYTYYRVKFLYED